jgi:hypothetical protein
MAAAQRTGRRGLSCGAKRFLWAPGRRSRNGPDARATRIPVGRPTRVRSDRAQDRFFVTRLGAVQLRPPRRPPGYAALNVPDRLDRSGAREAVSGGHGRAKVDGPRCFSSGPGWTAVATCRSTLPSRGHGRKGFALWAMDLFGVARARTGGHERAPRSVMRPRVGRAANVLLRASRRDVARLRSANRCGSRSRIEARSPNDT